MTIRRQGYFYCEICCQLEIKGKTEAVKLCSSDTVQICYIIERSKDFDKCFKDHRMKCVFAVLVCRICSISGHYLNRKKGCSYFLLPNEKLAGMVLRKQPTFLRWYWYVYGIVFYSKMLRKKPTGFPRKNIWEHQ